MNISQFSGFKRLVLEQNLGVYAVHIYKKGQESIEILFRDDNREHLFSGSKTFTSMAVGIAEGEGLLSLEDKTISYFPEYENTAVKGSEEITVKDLLQMRAGHLKPLFSTDPRHARARD